jgi:hypothetical protein
MISVDCGAPYRDPFAHEAVLSANSSRLLCASPDSPVPQYVPDGDSGDGCECKTKNCLAMRD